MISDEKKEEVREAADITEVIADYVKLRRSGNGFVGLCPFHNEKTPSFHVTPHLNIYKCFGCGAGGDVFNFVMEMEGVGFNEAIRTLAERYGVLLPAEKEKFMDPELTEKEGIYHALRFAGLYYHRLLMEHEEAEYARKYLAGRGYRRETVKGFGLGYSLKRSDALKQTALKASINEEYLVKAGLLKSDSNGIRSFDTFRGRLMFPIFNPSGKVIAFGGRILAKSNSASGGDVARPSGPTGPKYINSPQTPVYNKSEVLYGIHAAKNEIRKEKEAILVEGYTDVITMHQNGVRNVVSTSGTALTPEQMRILCRYGETLLMIYDADAAGQAAMVRGINIALNTGLGIRLMQLPEGEDPDSFIRQFGKDGFSAYKKEHARDFLSYLIRVSEQKGEWDDPVTRPGVISRLIESIAEIPDEVTKETFIQKLGRESRIGDRKLFEQLGVILARRKEKHRKDEARAELRKKHMPAETSKERSSLSRPVTVSAPVQQKMPGYEKELIRLMLRHGNDMVEYIGSLCNEDHFEDERLRSFYKDIISRFEAGKPVSVDAYAGREHPFPEILGEIVTERFTASERGNGGSVPLKDKEPYKSARGAIKPLKMQFLDNLKIRYTEEYLQTEEDGKKQLSELLSRISQQRSKLSTTPSEKAFPKSEFETRE